jgi:hypothetical protein
VVNPLTRIHKISRKAIIIIQVVKIAMAMALVVAVDMVQITTNHVRPTIMILVHLQDMRATLGESVGPTSTLMVLNKAKVLDKRITDMEIHTTIVTTT